MQITLKGKKFILYLLLCVLIFSGVHTTPVSTTIITAQAQGSSVFMRSPAISQPDDCLAEQVSSRHSAPTFTNTIRSARTGSSYRVVLLFLLCVLTLLSVFSKLIENLIALHDERYLHKENFTISFMQDADGRKRIS